MPASITMTNLQKVGAGVSIVDADGQPFSTLPPGVTVDFVSSDPAVAAVTVLADGMNIEVGSGQVGTATVTATATFPDATVFSDTLAVAVQNSAPGSVNFTVGTPIDE
jgi:hypothetical protein